MDEDEVMEEDEEEVVSDEKIPTKEPRRKRKKKKSPKIEADASLIADIAAVKEDIVDTNDSVFVYPVLQSDTRVAAVVSSPGSGTTTPTTDLPVGPIPTRQPSERVFLELPGRFKRIKKEVAEHQVCSQDPTVCTEELRLNVTAVQAAVFAHRMCQYFYTMCHGLCAGMSVWQCVVVYSLSPPYFSWADFNQHYSALAYPAQGLFYMLLAVCLLSAMDQCDFGRPVTTEEYRTRFYIFQRGLLVMLVYLTTLLISLCATSMDDNIGLRSFIDRGVVMMDDIDEQELVVWRRLNLARCVCAIIGWLLLVFKTGSDKLSEHLSQLSMAVDAVGQPNPFAHPDVQTQTSITHGLEFSNLPDPSVAIPIKSSEA